MNSELHQSIWAVVVRNKVVANYVTYPEAERVASQIADESLHPVTIIITSEASKRFEHSPYTQSNETRT
jgi:hypothetical protein